MYLIFIIIITKIHICFTNGKYNFFIENTLIRQLQFNKIKFITLWTTNEKQILVLFLQDIWSIR